MRSLFSAIRIEGAEAAHHETALVVLGCLLSLGLGCLAILCRGGTDDDIIIGRPVAVDEDGTRLVGPIRL